MTYGSSPDVETSLLRSLNEREEQYVDDWLERAEWLIRSRVGDLDARVAADPSYADIVRGVEGEMVARVFRNPDGVTQEDEGNYSVRIDSAVASGVLSVQLSEWELLDVSGHGLRSAAGLMDGYARARYASDPSLQFQYGWPGGGSLLWPS
jgi:hypothetical protein